MNHSDVPAEARQAAVNAAAAYEPEAFGVHAGNPKYFLSVLLETARRAVEAAAPAIAAQAAADEREDIRKLALEVRAHYYDDTTYDGPDFLQFADLIRARDTT